MEMKAFGFTFDQMVWMIGNLGTHTNLSDEQLYALLTERGNASRRSSICGCREQLLAMAPEPVKHAIEYANEIERMQDAA